MRVPVYYGCPLQCSTRVPAIKFLTPKSFFLISTIALLGTPFIAFAQSGVATAEANATIFEDDTDGNGGIYGEICIGNLAGTGATRRAFVKFELPDIPADATITRVEYNFVQVRPG